MKESAVIFGSKGMLARALAQELSARSISFVGVDLPECDITRPTDVAAIFQQHRPTLVFNCAAFTRVDDCETKQDLANDVNGHAVGTLAEICKGFDAKLIHISTDFVFDGRSNTPYQPSDKPAPLSAYGRSKLLGETLLQSVSPRQWAIIRTAWLYGVGGASFPRTMVTVARSGKPLTVVSDQHGCPTYTVDLARAMVDVAATDACGIFHCTNNQPTTWYDFACETLRQFNISADIKPISTQEYRAMRPSSAMRPAYSVLDCTSLEHAIGRPMRHWQDGLADFVSAVEANSGF